MVDKPTSAALHPGPGFRICTSIDRPDADVVEGLREFETPAASDLMNRLYTMRSEIHTLTDPDLRLVGPACTVKVFPGDNLMVHKSLDVAQPGDVIVGDADGLLVIPPALVEEVVEAAIEQEREEEYIAEQVAAGHPVDGLFPMNAEWKERYRAWRTQQ